MKIAHEKNWERVGAGEIGIKSQKYLLIVAEDGNNRWSKQRGGGRHAGFEKKNGT